MNVKINMPENAFHMTICGASTTGGKFVYSAWYQTTIQKITFASFHLDYQLSLCSNICYFYLGWFRDNYSWTQEKMEKTGQQDCSSRILLDNASLTTALSMSLHFLSFSDYSILTKVTKAGICEANAK